MFICRISECSRMLKYNIKSTSFSPEEFETALFQNGCLAFRSPARIDFLLELKSSDVSVVPGTAR
jgi:hypothetical protein